jgi:archaetidylserine synthase
LFPRDEDRRAFGGHLDSLSDVAAFGVAPPVCLAALSLPSSAPVEVIWWSAAFIYAVCAITRLGFYNLSHASSHGFIGLPVPVAALIFSSALLLAPGPVLSIALLVVTALAMIAPLRIPRPAGAGLVLFALWPVVLVVAHLALPR